MLRTTKVIALVAALSALLTGGKFVFAMIPNVEVVTLLIAVFASRMKLRYTIPVVITFVTTEILIYGMNTWVLSYYIYWTALALVMALVGRSKHRFITVPIAAGIMTTLFGVLTTLVDVLILTDLSQFGTNFTIMYIRGGWFYLTHIVSNILIVSVSYPVLYNAFNKLYVKYLGYSDMPKRQ